MIRKFKGPGRLLYILITLISEFKRRKDHYQKLGVQKRHLEVKTYFYPTHVDNTNDSTVEWTFGTYIVTLSLTNSKYFSFKMIILKVYDLKRK